MLRVRLRGRLDSHVAGSAAHWLFCDWKNGGSGWRAARSGPWNWDRRHINIKEAVAAGMLVRWFASQPSLAHERRCIVLG